jgi:hypothetical protein
MKHRHRKEKKRFVVMPSMLEINLCGSKTTYFVVCRCGAIYYNEQWIDDSERIKDITRHHKFEIARAMVPYEQLQHKNDRTY